MSHIRTIVLHAAFVAALLAGNPAHAASPASTDEVAALKEQIAQLEAKVAQLEQQANKKMPCGKPAMAQQPGMSMDDEFADPFENMAQMNRQIQAMMSGMGMPMRQMQNMHSGMFAPDYDIKSTDKNYVISFDMPGMDKSKINVEVKNGALLVSGERFSESKEDQAGKFYRQQRSFGSFSRMIPLPEDVKAESVSAKYDNGVLTVTVEKKEQVKQAPAKQKIEVK